MPSHRSTALVCVALLALVWAVFGRAAGFGFISFDDDRYIDHNPALEAGLSPRGLAWAFTANLTYQTTSAEYWEPITLLTRLADYEMHGFAPGGHHVTSIVLHALAGLALYGALRHLTGAHWRSAAVAALFLVHPMSVESVVWLAARKDVLSGLFYILTLWACGWHAAKPGWGRWLLMAAMFLGANMSKPMAISLPFAMLLLDFWPLGLVRLGEEGWRARLAQSLRAKAPFFVVSAALSVLVMKLVGSLPGEEFIPLPCRFGIAAIGLATYVWKTFVPTGLAFFYPNPGCDLDVLQAGAGAALLLIITVIVLREYRRRPWLTAGWLWFLVMIGPVSGIVQVGDQAMADRYAYLALSGIFIAALWQLRESCTPRVATATVTAVVLVFAVLARAQVETWRSSESVFVHGIETTDENYVAHFNLGSTLGKNGHREEALAHLAEAERIRRPYLTRQLARAEAAVERGDISGAVPHLARVLRLRPWDSELHHRTGTLLVKNGELNKALVQFNDALKYRPTWNEPRLSIAEVLIAQGQPERAASILRDALKVEPEHPRARALLDRIAPVTSPPPGASPPAPMPQHDRLLAPPAAGR